MASFELNSKQAAVIKALGYDYCQPFRQLVAEAIAFYEAKLLTINPANFKSPEEFIQKWAFYQGSLEAAKDIFTILIKENENDRRN